ALFLVAMFFTPLYEVVPVEAAAPALIVVGALMMSQIVQIDFSRFAVALPAFLTIVTMPFTYSIANGIGVGFIACVVLASATGKARSVHPLLWVVAAAFRVYFGSGAISDAIARARDRARRRRPRPGRSASGRSPRPQQLRPATRPPRRPRACGRRGHLRGGADAPVAVHPARPAGHRRAHGPAPTGGRGRGLGRGRRGRSGGVPAGIQGGHQRGDRLPLQSRHPRRRRAPRPAARR